MLIMLIYWAEAYVSYRKTQNCSTVVSIKNIGLEVNVDEIKYTFVSRDQNAGRSHTIMGDNISFERVERFLYLGKTLTKQNSIEEEIKSRLNSGNACYYSVQNILSLSLLS